LIEEYNLLIEEYNLLIEKYNLPYDIRNASRVVRNVTIITGWNNNDIPLWRGIKGEDLE
jgi:hypothetical protein